MTKKNSLPTLEISLLTFKKGKIYGVMSCDNHISDKMSRVEFVASVEAWAIRYFSAPYTIFVANDNGLYSVIIVVDYNKDHEDSPQTLEIPIVKC